MQAMRRAHGSRSRRLRPSRSSPSLPLRWPCASSPSPGSPARRSKRSTRGRCCAARARQGTCGSPPGGSRWRMETGRRAPEPCARARSSRPGSPSCAGAPRAPGAIAPCRCFRAWWTRKRSAACASCCVSPEAYTSPPLPEAFVKTLAASLLASLALAATAAPLGYPAAPKKPVTDTFFGTKVTEDYRWLEDGKDPAVRAWSQAQMKVTREYVDALPILPKLRAELKDLYGNAPPVHRDLKFAGSLFALKRQPPKNQPFLVVMKDPADAAHERVLVDPNTMQAGTTIDWYVPS